MSRTNTAQHTVTLRSAALESNPDDNYYMLSFAADDDRKAFLATLQHIMRKR